MCGALPSLVLSISGSVAVLAAQHPAKSDLGQSAARPQDGWTSRIRQGVQCKILRDKRVNALDPVAPLPGRRTRNALRLWVRKWLQHNLLYEAVARVHASPPSLRTRNRRRNRPDQLRERKWCEKPCKPDPVRPFRGLNATVISLGPTSPPASNDQPGRKLDAGWRHMPFPIWSFSRWGLPSRPRLRGRWCALTAPFHPYLCVPYGT